MDRKALIKIASELPKGSEARRVLLSELQKQGGGKPGHQILEDHLSDKYGYGGKMGHFWFDGNLDGGGKSSKVPTNLSPDNPYGPKEKWMLRGGGEYDGVGQNPLGLPTGSDYGIWWTIEGDFTRFLYDGPHRRGPFMPWTGNGKIHLDAALFNRGESQVDLDTSTVNFSFIDGGVYEVKNAFDKAVKKLARQAQATYARLIDPQVWSAVVGYDGEASHIQTFDNEADAQRALNSMKGNVSYDVVEGEQLWNKSVGTTK